MTAPQRLAAALDKEQPLRILTAIPAPDTLQIRGERDNHSGYHKFQDEPDSLFGQSHDSE